MTICKNTIVGQMQAFTPYTTSPITVIHSYISETTAIYKYIYEYINKYRVVHPNKNIIS